jgi:hypothetical protein
MNDSAYLTTIIKNLYAVPAFTDIDDCLQQGEAAACQGYCRDINPYPIVTSMHEWWDQGWCSSYDQLTGGADDESNE